MDSDTNLPQIFYDLLDKATVADRISSDTIQQYCDKVREEESFLPDLLDIVGLEAFETMVQYHGGQKIQIPRPEEVIAKVRNNE